MDFIASKREPESSVECTLTERDGVIVVGVRGEIDLANAHVLQTVLDRATHDGRPVVVDLEKTSYIDSTGLHLLVKARSASRTHMVVAFRSELISRIFSVLSLQDLIAVYPSVEAAVDALSPMKGGAVPPSSCPTPS